MTDLIDDTAPRLGSTTPLPKIISVDDHLVEPAHLWQTWLPVRFRDRGPKAERRGIGEMEHIGGGTYRQSFDPDGPKPTAGSTRTWSISTSATWLRSDSTGTT
jgi:hypothetical protein